MEITVQLKSSGQASRKPLSDDQINSIYRLFSALDVNNSGEVDANLKKEADTDELKDLFKEIEVFLADKDNSNTVTFAEFLDQFSKSLDTPSTSQIDHLANDFTRVLQI